MFCFLFFFITLKVLRLWEEAGEHQNLQTPHRKVPGWELNPQPSRCEMAALTIEPARHINATKKKENQKESENCLKPSQPHKTSAVRASWSPAYFLLTVLCARVCMCL